MNKEETDLIIAEQNKSTEEILKAVAKVKADYHELCKLKDMRIAELEAEVKEWKDKADLWCKTANLKDHNIMINKELEKENADLKEEINKIAFARGNLEEENAELKEELKKWKDEWQEQVQKATDEGYERTLQTMQLNKAKVLLKQFLEAKNGEDTYKAEWEAEQFLNSEVEK